MFLRLLFVLILCAGLVRAAGSTPAADLVIYGATPGGIATAVRAARDGLRVTLVHHHAHIGGMLSNGLGVFDTVYDGKRAPVYDEVFARIRGHYAAPDRRDLVQERHYEPHVAEKVLEAMLAEQKDITVVREYYPVAAARRGRQVVSATFRQMDGTATLTLAAPAFVDASYEGDLASVAGVEMTIGREGRAQYGEPHAGRVFTKLRPVSHPAAYPDGTNLRVFPLMANELLPGSTGESDRAIQAFNFRVCLTREPDNRIAVTKPARYERELYLDLKDRWGFGNATPVLKRSWNAPLLIGGNFDYPSGDWTKRREIAARHKDLAIGLLWFLQNDEVVPEPMRAEARRWGLPKNEFRDNGGFPWEMYVREARRLVGRHVYTQHDGMAAPGLQRAPVHTDSIAITEWPLDSHSCHLDTLPGSDHEGKVLLPEETRPGQIAYRCLLPRDVDNLLVTGCMSSSHIGWGSVRLEPVFMHVGESAAVALALARARGCAPADVPMDALQRQLAARGVMISFFNDFDASAFTSAQRAAQYFGTKGFFASYDARLDLPLTAAIAQVWAQPSPDTMETARRVAAAETQSAGPITAAEFARLRARPSPGGPVRALKRGEALEWLFAESP